MNHVLKDKIVTYNLKKRDVEITGGLLTLKAKTKLTKIMELLLLKLADISPVIE